MKVVQGRRVGGCPWLQIATELAAHDGATTHWSRGSQGFPEMHHHIRGGPPKEGRQEEMGQAASEAQKGTRGELR